MNGRTLTINMGPQHPSTHGVLRLIVELDGEKVVRAVPDIGFLHRGIEKLAEYRTWEQFLPFTDRLDYVAASAGNLAYCLAVEKLMEMEVPRRASYIRVMLAEVARISAHLIWLGSSALDLGAMGPMFYAFADRERTWDLFEMSGGSRMTHSFMRIGGLRNDLDADTLRAFGDFCDYFPSSIDRYEELLTGNPLFRARTIGIGRMGAAEILNRGVTGPVARASGVDWDLRRDEPYAAYGDLEFDVPVREGGDVYDRYLVRVAEMRQSVRMIRQALDGLPGGDWRSRDARYVRPSKEDALAHVESMTRYFYLASEGPAPPPGEAYAAVEAPKGELGFYVRSNGTPYPARVKIRTPSFANLAALPAMIQDHFLSDVVAVIGSIDIVLGEVDR
jgi:NADH-quinone oxidoreductase subunit D